MSLIIDGKAHDVPGLRTQNWLDNPLFALKRPEDCRARRGYWIRAIVLHTTKGIPGGKDKRPQHIIEGIGPDTNAEERVANWWSRDGKQAAAHLVVDFDGTVTCLADLRAETTFHCVGWNDASIGIEIVQGQTNAELYEGQLDAVVKLVDWLTGKFGIQRQIPDRYRNKPVRRLEKNAPPFVGVIGHRDASNDRGAGDPGTFVMEMLAEAGYERFDVDAGEDIAVWKLRQAGFDVRQADGIPGPGTVGVMKQLGFAHGLWVSRAGDAP